MLSSEVWAGIRAAQETGFAPIKLNAVVMHGVNDDEIEALACLTYHYPFEVRFIEFMPFQSEEGDNRLVSADDILERLNGVAPLLPAVSESSNGSARHYRFPNARQDRVSSAPSANTSATPATACA